MVDRHVQRPIEPFPHRSSVSRPGVSLFICLFLSAALLVFSKLQIETVTLARGTVASLVSPVLGLATYGVGVVRSAIGTVANAFDAAARLETMRHENQRLRAWEWRARELERKVTQLSAITHVADDTGLAFVSGRVVADGKGPLTISVLADVGTAHGVRDGDAAVNGDGLVGHVVSVGEKASRILLLNDFNSRIPVLIGTRGTRAILTGDQLADPRLVHVGSEAAIEAGEEIVTSGHEGILPRGLRVGTVVMDGGSPRARLAVRREALDYISVLFFERPSLNGSSDAKPEPPADPLAAVR